MLEACHVIYRLVTKELLDAQGERSSWSVRKVDTSLLAPRSRTQCRSKLLHLSDCRVRCRASPETRRDGRSSAGRHAAPAVPARQGLIERHGSPSCQRTALQQGWQHVEGDRPAAGAAAAVAVVQQQDVAGGEVSRQALQHARGVGVAGVKAAARPAHELRVQAVLHPGTQWILIPNDPKPA